MSGRISGFINALYDPKKKQLLGRDGAAWTKLGVFYFFFYLGLAGFFCAMLAVFMALSPRDRPRYYSESSRMTTRSNPLSPGLGFRPQPEVDKGLILVDKHAAANETSPFVKSLNQYLQIFYWKDDELVDNEQDHHDDHHEKESNTLTKKFVIDKPGDCISDANFGFKKGKPCVLVKMNKIVGFMPKPGAPKVDKDLYSKTCNHKNDAVAIHCHGEYPADEDNIGDIKYFSESGSDSKCGSLSTKWFPYEGKINRKDTYQAPYIWVQFLNPKPNVLIHVLCRVFGENIDYDKKTGRALTRFQIYVKDVPPKAPSRRSGEF